MKRKINLFNVGITGFCVTVYATQWYNGVDVPAWQALVWCAATCLHEIGAVIRESEK